MFMQDKKEKMKSEMKKRVSPVKSVYRGDVFAVKNSRGLPGNIRAGFVPTSVLQKKSGGGVVQLSHIKNVIPNTQAAPQLVQNAKPTIVFESMASNSASAQSIFDQTKQYSGNTICVFGLNRRYTVPRAPLQLEWIGDVGIHFFRGFTFEWEKPGEVLETDQYKMPFIEARAEVMGQGEKIVNALPEDSIQSEHVPATDNSHKIVYRWIDGDAENDTSQEIPAEHLTALSEETMGVLSGPYTWKSGSESRTHKFYCGFIDRVNECEGRVREKYFREKGKLAEDMNSFLNVPEYLSNEGGLNGYYLPETTFMMSPNTHRVMLHTIRSRQAASDIYPEIGSSEKLLQVLERYRNVQLDGQLRTHMDNVRGNNFPASAQPLKSYIESRYSKDKEGFDSKSMQDKESMKMLFYANIAKNSVYFEPQLKVSKPLKREFETEGTNYLGVELLQLLKSGNLVEKEVFYQKLIKMRQSVFDKFWISEEMSPDFKRFKQIEVNKIYSYYKRHR
ncbi:MAG: hypothetical protein OSJ44_04800 [Lachnospiraceae bacterium]|nr:hypothetical protein [Lachnospiraceae bacterium]